MLDVCYMLGNRNDSTFSGTCEVYRSEATALKSKLFLVVETLSVYLLKFVCGSFNLYLNTNNGSQEMNGGAIL